MFMISCARACVLHGPTTEAPCVWRSALCASNLEVSQPVSLNILEYGSKLMQVANYRAFAEDRAAQLGTNLEQLLSGDSATGAPS